MRLYPVVQVGLYLGIRWLDRLVQTEILSWNVQMISYVSAATYLVIISLLPPANEVCEGYVYTGVCHSVHGGACVVAPGGGGGLCVVAPRGGMHGCSGGGAHAWLLRGGGCVAAWGAHAWLLRGGGLCGCLGGHVWLLPGGCMVASGGLCVVALGGHAWLLRGGHVWLLWGACVVAPGGRVWLLPGGRGHAWLLPGGGLHGFWMRYGQWAGGTHPTGMHTCFMYFSSRLEIWTGRSPLRICK